MAAELVIHVPAAQASRFCPLLAEALDFFVALLPHAAEVLRTAYAQVLPRQERPGA